MIEQIPAEQKILASVTFRPDGSKVYRVTQAPMEARISLEACKRIDSEYMQFRMRESRGKVSGTVHLHAANGDFPYAICGYNSEIGVIDLRRVIP